MTSTPGRLFALAALLALPAAADAQSWAAPTPGSWIDPANWSPMFVPNGVGANVQILGTAAGGPLASGGTITFGVAVTLGNLNVDMGLGGPSLMFSNQTITFDNGGGADVFLSADGSSGIFINGPIHLEGRLVSTWKSSNGRIDGPISGNYGILHDPKLPGINRIRLWGQNTYTGQTICRTGWISIRDAAGLGDPSSDTIIEAEGTLVVEAVNPITISAEDVTLQGGGAIFFRDLEWASRILLDGAGRMAPWFDGIKTTISGQITGTGPFIRESAQSRFTIDDSRESVLTLTNAANDYTGGTEIRSGILDVGADAALGSAGDPITFDIVGFSEGPPALLINATETIDRDITLIDAGWLRAATGQTATFPGTITGGAGLSINGFGSDGAVVLSGDNTFAGPTDVRQGVLVVANTAGSATGAGDVTVDEFASIAGDGAIAGAVDMAAGGALEPGFPLGELSVGALTLGPTSLTLIEFTGVSPGEFDSVAVAGTAVLDGELIALDLSPVAPAPGDEYVILTAASVSGAFAKTELPPEMEIEYTSTSVILRVAMDTCPADLDGSGSVGSGDLGVLLAAWGASGEADLDGSGVVGSGDLGILLAAWGACPM